MLGRILQFAVPIPDGTPVDDEPWHVRRDPETGNEVISKWDAVALGRAVPDQAEIDDWQNDVTVVNGQTFSQWIAERKGDPALTRRRLAREFLNSGEGAALVARAVANVQRQRENEIAALLQGIKDAFLNNTNTSQIRDAINLLPALTDPTVTKGELVQAIADDITSGESDAPV